MFITLLRTGVWNCTRNSCPQFTYYVYVIHVSLFVIFFYFNPFSKLFTERRKVKHAMLWKIKCCFQQMLFNRSDVTYWDSITYSRRYKWTWLQRIVMCTLNTKNRLSILWDEKLLDIRFKLHVYSLFYSNRLSLNCDY